MRIHQRYLGPRELGPRWLMCQCHFAFSSGEATENSWSPFKRIWNQNVELDICVMNLAARCMTWGSSRWLARLTSEPPPPPPELANILVAMIATLVVITLAPPCTMTTAVIMANTPTTSSILCACLCVGIAGLADSLNSTIPSRLSMNITARRWCHEEWWWSGILSARWSDYTSGRDLTTWFDDKNDGDMSSRKNETTAQARNSKTESKNMDRQHFKGSGVLILCMHRMLHWLFDKITFPDDKTVRVRSTNFLASQRSIHHVWESIDWFYRIEMI